MIKSLYPLMTRSIWIYFIAHWTSFWCCYSAPHARRDKKYSGSCPFLKRKWFPHEWFLGLIIPHERQDFHSCGNPILPTHLLWFCWERLYDLASADRKKIQSYMLTHWPWKQLKRHNFLRACRYCSHTVPIISFGLIYKWWNLPPFSPKSQKLST